MSTIHTIPMNDIIEHDTDSDECVCGPDIIYVENGGRQVIHYSLDGREFRETKEREE